VQSTSNAKIQKATFCELSLKANTVKTKVFKGDTTIEQAFSLYVFHVSFQVLKYKDYLTLFKEVHLVLVMFYRLFVKQKELGIYCRIFIHFFLFFFFFFLGLLTKKQNVFFILEQLLMFL